MKFALASMLFAAMSFQPPTADACGVKLTVKSAPPRKAVARSSNPSDILIVGDPSSRFKRDLTAEGHRVDVAPTVAQGDKKKYAVVITDASHRGEAQSRYPESVILVSSGSEDADVASIEGSVARRPTSTDQGRAVVAAREARQPIAAGPVQPPDRQLISARPAETPQPTVTTEQPAPEPTPTKLEVAKPVTQSVAPPKEQVARTVAPPAETRAASSPALKPNAIVIEVYFGTGNSQLARASALDAAVKQLKAHADVNVVIEGHADPTGTPDGNMALSQKRAEMVRDYLVQNGIDGSRLDVAPFGDTKLRYGRADGRNRRVAIVVK